MNLSSLQKKMGRICRPTHLDGLVKPVKVDFTIAVSDFLLLVKKLGARFMNEKIIQSKIILNLDHELIYTFVLQRPLSFLYLSYVIAEANSSNISLQYLQEIGIQLPKNSLKYSGYKKLICTQELEDIDIDFYCLKLGRVLRSKLYKDFLEIKLEKHPVFLEVFYESHK